MDTGLTTTPALKFTMELAVRIAFMDELDVALEPLYAKAARDVEAIRKARDDGEEAARARAKAYAEEEPKRQAEWDAHVERCAEAERVKAERAERDLEAYFNSDCDCDTDHGYNLLCDTGYESDEDLDDEARRNAHREAHRKAREDAYWKCQALLEANS
jgi:hypothetical protein